MSAAALTHERPQLARHALLALGVLLAVLAASLGGAAAARAEGAPWWRLDVQPAPTNLPPGGEAVITVIATNLGDAPAEGASSQIVLGDKLPLPASMSILEVTGHLSRTGFKGVHATEKEEKAAALMHGEGVAGGEACTPVNPEAEFEVRVKEEEEKRAEATAKQTKEEPIVCTFAHPVVPFEALVMQIKVKVEPAAAPTEANEAKISGAGAATPLVNREPFTISATPTPFGISRFEMTPEAEGGQPDSLAGDHAFQLTSIIDLNLTRAEFHSGGFTKIFDALPALPRNFAFHLPPGLLGNPTATPRCSEADFSALQTNLSDLCPPSTQVGAAVVHATEPKNLNELVITVPVFNLQPAPGEPARFGFYAAHALIYIDTAVSDEEQYAATALVTNATQVASLLSSVVTLWGNPGNKVHDPVRGWKCIESERINEEEYTNEKATFEKEHPGETFPPYAPCKTLEEEHEPRTTTPFLILPTACGKSIGTKVEGVSWPTPTAPAGFPITPKIAMIQEITGCNSLEFNPEMSVTPDTEVGSTPTGLSVGLHIPQTGTLSESPARATSATQSTVVTLPEGVLLNPGAASGLLACTPLEIGVKSGFEDEHAEGVQKINENEGFTAGVPACISENNEKSKYAKVGVFTIKTPLLDHEIEGAVYLGSQDTAPFEPPLVLYLIVNDEQDGIRVKLAGSVTPNPTTGQLTTTFKNTPELPFEDLKLHFFGEGRASVTTPGACGTYTTSASFTPWSTVTSSSGGEAKGPVNAPTFAITSGPGGASCTPPLPLSPSIRAGTPAGGTNEAGKYSNLSVTIARPDGDEAISGLNVTLPSGVAGVLANVTPCPEAQAANGTCGEESRIGNATSVSGLGTQPFTITGGRVYLTVGYGGGPFGLSIVFENVTAGPFHIGTPAQPERIVVRSGIFVNETTAAVTIKTAVPTFVETIPGGRKGVPVQLKETNVETLATLATGKRFEFNPTNCSPLPVQAEFAGAEGGTGTASTTLQFAGCEKLAFSPGFEAEVGGQGSKASGVGFKVVTTSQGIGVANIKRVHLALPGQLPSRLTTIQKACGEATFNANPASCPEGSNIGSAHIETPVLKSPLAGPAYLVSHGGAGFPDVEFVLQGEGIKLLLDGKTDIKKGITYSTFESTPDAPFTRFETNLPAGPHSALTANVAETKHFNLCGEKLTIPLELTSQSGVLIKEPINVKVTGCKATTSLTRAQKLAKALAACHKKYKHSKTKRKACERTARRKYGPKKTSHKKAHKAAHKSASHR